MKFNLGPLHQLGGLAEEILDLKSKEYVYKKKSSGQLATRASLLVDQVEGAAVATFRWLEEERAHVPIEMWTM